MGHWFDSSHVRRISSIFGGVTRWLPCPVVFFFFLVFFLFIEQQPHNNNCIAEKFLEKLTAKTNTVKLVKHGTFTFLSPPELWAGDGESQDSFSQAECICQEPAELHHRQAAQRPLRRQSHP